MSLLRRNKDSGSEHPTTGDLGHSQFGTPLDEILFAFPNYDALKWTTIPGNWDGYWKSPQTWAEDYAPNLWAMWHQQNPGAPAPDPEAIARTTLELKTLAEKFGGFRPQEPFDITTYLHLPSPTVLALPVRVFVDDYPGRTAEEAAGADATDTLEPPVVEEFTNPALGTGLKVTAYRTLAPETGDEADDKAVWVQVRYAFKISDKQAVVTVTTSDTDLGRVAGANQDLDEFVRSITVRTCN